LTLAAGHQRREGKKEKKEGKSCPNSSSGKSSLLFDDNQFILFIFSLFVGHKYRVCYQRYSTTVTQKQNKGQQKSHNWNQTS
jgi:hypothetical protein